MEIVEIIGEKIIDLNSHCKKGVLFYQFEKKHLEL